MGKRYQIDIIKGEVVQRELTPEEYKTMTNCEACSDGLAFLPNAKGEIAVYRCRCPKGSKHPEAIFSPSDVKKERPIKIPLAPAPAPDKPSGRDRQWKDEPLY
jgi:hypothetical protein